ncbi:hypothetical protein Chor_002307, partial [Crotalus horridus]
NITDELAAAKAFPMENQNTKKVLSECCNTQRNLYLRHGNSINSMKKMDSLFTSGSSDAPATNVCTSPVICKSLGSTLINNHPNVVNDRDDLTTPRRKSEENTNVEISNNPVTPSRGFSDRTAVDCRITPDCFTSQNKEEFKNILKKLRRRSTIGARGSPENDSLIRYIARQRRMKMQETLSQPSPSQHRNTLLKDKIAAFQCSFKALEETEEKAIHIHSVSNTRLHERSVLSQTWSPEDTNNAFEENLNNKFMNGDGISADIQMHSPRFPSRKPLVSGTNVMSKADPVSPANAVESTSVSTPSTGISKSDSGEDKELSRNDTSRPSSKKVRFSEKQSLEIFDESKPPITPVGKGHSFPSSLRSALKKTPVKIVSEGSKDLQGSSEKMTTPIRTGLSDPEERKNNSPDHQAPLIRTTRNSAKKKCVKGKNLATKTEAQNQLNQLQKAKTSTKSQKNPAAQPKMVEKRRRRRRGKKKEEQKVFYGPRERVSKKPLLSPILEITENASFYDSLSDLHATFIDEMAEDKKSPPHAVGVDGHDQHSSPEEEDGVSSSFVQLPELALNNREQWLPGYVPEKISPEKLKSSLNGNEQVVGTGCLSSRTAMQLEEFLNICGPGKNIEAKENSFFTVDFATEAMSESNKVNFERNPRNSRKSRGDFLNTEGAQSNNPGNSTGVPGGNLEGLPPCSWTADDIAALNHFGGNRNVTKKVRRSMRGQKDAEAEGLAWVEVPAADLSQIPLQSACKVPKRLSSAGPQGSKHAANSPCGPRRRSFCALDAEKDQRVLL